MFDTLKQINWIDILVVILILRIGYIALKKGLAVEFFKILGTISATYLSLHYYINLSDFIQNRIGLKSISSDFLNAFSFSGLAILGYLIFMVLQKIFSRFVKMEAAPELNKWGGFILGIARAFLFTSLVIFILVISGVNYFKRSIKDSYSGRSLYKVAPLTYRSLWNGFFSKFMTNEKLNEAIFEVKKRP